MAAVSTHHASFCGTGRRGEAPRKPGTGRRAEAPAQCPDPGAPQELDRPPGHRPDIQTRQCREHPPCVPLPPHPEAPRAHPVTSQMPPAPSPSFIPVPKRRMDEAMAAAVLTSLSTSPLVLGAGTAERRCDSWGDDAPISSSYFSADPRDLGSDTSDPSPPSPPLPPVSSSAQSDVNVEDSDTTHFLFGDPIPRKRKNSGLLMFRCLWKNCGKVLSTSSAIQKHIRVVHLGRHAEQEHSDGEEDFYYTEMDVTVDTLTDGLSSLTPTSPTTTAPPAFPCAESRQPQNDTELPLVSPLCLSAPSTLCHVYTDHAYQALSPVTISPPSKLSLSFSWQPPPLLIRAPLVQPALEACEKRPPILTTVTNSKPAAGARKARGEAKKCRKVYGMERRDLWCTACRWKKACQRFMD